MTEPFARGGMCSNPFGGEDRIDRINLIEHLGGNALPEKVLYSCIIQDAASNYLYAFLGKNGTSAEEFFAAHQYFFKVVSTNKMDWDHHRTIKQSFIRKGMKVTEDRYLIDSELKLMCFDKHYDMSGLAEHMHIDKFRAGLKAKRRRILSANWEQVQTYITALYQHELSMIADRQQVPLQVWTDELLEVLVDPPTPLQLASIIYVPNKLKRARRPRAQRQLSTGVYTSLAKRLEENKFQPLGQDWGPLAALLEGAEDDQVTDNNLDDSVHCNDHRHSVVTSSSDCGQANVEDQAVS